MKYLVPLFAALAALAQSAQAAAPETALPAFPGAEGFGRYATGGRGGEVYHVTHLMDKGPGSFRDAVSRPNRIIVFETNGVITLGRRLIISSNLTIAGQTAPGDGITLYGNGASFSGADNTITRHIRFRMGTKGDAGRDAVSLAHGNNMIFDHVSVSWGRDENFSINGSATNVTIQDCIISQGLQHHSAGGLIQTSGGVSILRTLYIDNHTRNPKVKGVNQYVNNVVYNWGGGAAYILGDSEGASYANVVNNCFINGPNSSAPAFSRGNTNFRLFADGNVQDANRNGRFDATPVARAAYGVVAWQEQPFAYPIVETVPALEAFTRVAAQAGASLRRVGVDRHLIDELLSFGTVGQIITNDLANLMEPSVAGRAWIDSDRDGMPDVWESATGLNPRDPADGNQRSGQGYSRLEEYLHWKAEPNASTPRNEPLVLDLQPLLGMAPTQRLEVSDPKHCQVLLLADGRSARLTPDRGFTGRAGFRISTGAPDAWTREVEVLVHGVEAAQP
jgi:pectate lyase